MTPCAACKQPKEPSRVKSRLCRSCDKADRERRTGKRVTLNIPREVWVRLSEEATRKDQTVEALLTELVTSRDARITEREGES